MTFFKQKCLSFSRQVSLVMFSFSYVSQVNISETASETISITTTTKIITLIKIDLMKSLSYIKKLLK